MEQLLPQFANALVSCLMNPDLPVLIKAEKGCLGVIADGPECLSDGTEAIDQAVAIGEPRMPQHICQA